MRTRGNDRGAALMTAVLCMLILAIFAMSVAVLADLEARVGGNHKAAQQAFGLTEAALEHGRNIIKSAATAGNFKDFTNFISSASARQLGIPAAGISLGSGHYWVRVDNDCPPLVPAAIQDTPGGVCPDVTDTNKTAVLTAWAEATDGAGRVIGRARVRAHYTMGGAWGHSCYNGNDQLCIQDDVGGCNNNPCIDPSDPENPNGPAKGPLPGLTDIKCGTSQIPSSDIPTDVANAAGWTSTWPCVIYPYYTWALHQALPTRQVCKTVISANPGYGTDHCSSVAPGTYAWTTNPLDPNYATCVATPSKCHGAVFFGPGNSSTPGNNVVTGADVAFGTNTNDDAVCIGKQRDRPTENCYDATIAASSSAVAYVMGKVRLTNNISVYGTLVLHGNQTAGSSPSNADLGLTGTVQIVSFPCVAGSPAPAPGCGYPLAILAYNPNEPAPTTATGQTIYLSMSDSTAIVRGIIYTGGTAAFGPINVDGGVIGWDVNIGNTATRIAYNSTYGNASPPPGFTDPASDPAWTVSLYRATWVHCINYANDYNGSTSCD